jgi:hypothetical protein
MSAAPEVQNMNTIVCTKFGGGGVREYLDNQAVMYSESTAEDTYPDCVKNKVLTAGIINCIIQFTMCTIQHLKCSTFSWSFNLLVTIIKIRSNIHLGVKKPELNFILDILICH